ncbi:hypothetical protein ACHAW5_009880 [Stephanodiscus triporus]|uniref:Carrier domain-containing protein n=1 Tax=Stephanodiscus triporus TaxID=2934178 RepID=A0ABD3Q1T5_9STRA
MVDEKDPGALSSGGPGAWKKKTKIRNITNADGTRTVITTVFTTKIDEETMEKVTTEEVDTKHLPSLPRVRREMMTKDNVTGFKTTSTVVLPSGQREITITYPNGEKEVQLKDGVSHAQKKSDHSKVSESSPVEAKVKDVVPAAEEVVIPTWSSYSWDSLLKRLSRHAEFLPDKTAISFLQSGDYGKMVVSSHITYQELSSAVEYLASRLLPPDAGDGTAPKKKDCLVPIQKGQPPLARGDRVLLVYPPCSPHFILTFLACIRAGLVAVPVYPPHPGRKDSVSAFVGIARGCGARVALTDGQYAQAKRLISMKSAFVAKIKKLYTDREGGDGEVLPTWPEELIWVVTDGEPLTNPPPIGSYPRVETYPEPHEVAFIQYTSGSTSSPKGVTLTHSNLAHNLHIITSEMKATVATKVVSWLPQYHDMGLIGSLIGVIYCGGSGWYMSPIAFLQRPMAWLEAVSEYRATHLQAPNFAFGLTARKFNPNEYIHGMNATISTSHVYTNTEEMTNRKIGKKVKSLELSCLKHIVNGAEPVTEVSMEAFRRAFSPFGLPDGVIYPTYGLAEHTVFVCSGGKGKIAVIKKAMEEINKAIVVEVTESTNRDDVLEFIGCGFPSSQNVDVQIVDPGKGIPLPDGKVGEIWINSPSKAVGYYGKSDVENKDDFHAFLEYTPIKSDGYLRSGDLGFMHEGQLYICGRIKDLIIIGGKNHYPQDIEATAEDLASEHVRPGCSAAFSSGSTSDAMGDYDEIVLAMELKMPHPTVKKCEVIADSIRTEILKVHGVSLSCIILVKHKTIPKTTSGKIQRSKTQREFLGRQLQEIFRKEYKTGNVEDSLNFEEEDEDFTESDDIENVKGKGKENGNPNYDVADNGDMIEEGNQSAPNSDFDGFLDLLEGKQSEQNSKKRKDLTPQSEQNSKERKDLTPAEIRALDKQEIRNLLIESISQLANIDKTAIKDGAPLNSLMDSVTLAQLKGLLEGKYAVKPMSDAYLFQDSTTLKKLVEIIKVGAANDDSGAGHVGGASAGGGGSGCCGCTVM